MAKKPTYRELEKRIQELEQAESERKHAVNELQKRETTIQSVFDATPVGICIMKNRVYQRVNRDWCESFGYSEDNLIGKTTEFLYESHEERERVGEELYKNLLKKGIAFARTRLKRSDGEFRDVDLIAKPLDPYDLEAGTVVVVNDITKRKRSEEALRQSELNYRSIFNAVNDAVFVHEMETGRILDVNQKMCQMLGYTTQEIRQMNVGDLSSGASPYTQEDALKWINKAVDGNPQLFEWMAKDSNGKLFWVEVNLKRVTIGGKDRLLAVIRDINERKQDEEEHEKLQAQLHQAQKMESIGTLAGGIAHDFNNILFPLMGYAEMLKLDLPADSPLHAHIDEILHAASRSKDLVKQILAFSRQGDQDIKLIKLQPIVKEVTKLLRSSIPTTIDIQQDIDPDCGVVVADPGQIHQMVMNLATNAYHAMEKSGGKLSVSLKEVEFSLKDLKDQAIPGMYACLTVADTGPGMEQRVIDRIFDPYFTTKEKGKGTGLGLAVVHGIVKSHGGQVSVYSEPGKGTEFQICLPIMKNQKETTKVETNTPTQKGNERILLVDDQDIIVQMEKQMLERLGYHVTARTSSVEALETFRTKLDTFDLIITDMTMPNMTGDKLAAEIMKIRSDIPVILCTGFSETISKKKAKALGIKGFLMKPIVMQHLSRVIRDVLDNP